MIEPAGAGAGLDERAVGTGAEARGLGRLARTPGENLASRAPSLCPPAQGRQHLRNWRLLRYEVTDASRIPPLPGAKAQAIFL